MYICVKLNLKVDKYLEKSLIDYERNFKKEIHRMDKLFHEKGYTYEIRYKEINNEISYNCKHLVLLTAKEKYTKECKGCRFKYSFSSYWSNSSYSLDKFALHLQLGLSKRKQILSIPYYFSEQQWSRMSNGNIMNMKILYLNHKWFSLIYIDMPVEKLKSGKVMGIDIGIKVPAVTAIDETHVKFFGNGREMRYQLRKYRSHIHEMQLNNQKKKLKSFDHKLHNVMNDYDHKISREIIDYALKEGVSIIKLERLWSITSKIEKSDSVELHQWSYRRLQEYIAYKAQLNGIHVQYINPYNTSKKCPACGKLNKANDRKYICSCGYSGHRDAVGAINILHAL